MDSKMCMSLCVKWCSLPGWTGVPENHQYEKKCCWLFPIRIFWIICCLSRSCFLFFFFFSICLPICCTVVWTVLSVFISEHRNSDEGERNCCRHFETLNWPKKTLDLCADITLNILQSCVLYSSDQCKHTLSNGRSAIEMFFSFSSD